MFLSKKERNVLSTGASLISQIPFRLPATSCESLGPSAPHFSMVWGVFFNRIWFPLYFLIYRMIFSRQWIILFWWYLTPTSLIFAGQRIKTDWGKTWGWTLFRWVSFVLCPAFLMIGNNKEATLRKKKWCFFILLGLPQISEMGPTKYQDWDFWQERVGQQDVISGCRELIISSGDTGLWSFISHPFSQADPKYSAFQLPEQCWADCIATGSYRRR